MVGGRGYLIPKMLRHYFLLWLEHFPIKLLFSVFQSDISMLIKIIMGEYNSSMVKGGKEFDCGSPFRTPVKVDNCTLSLVCGASSEAVKF